MNPNDPAFPRTYADRERAVRHEDGKGYEFGVDGLTVRQFFAANAPAEPQAWFQPVLPPRPEAPAKQGFPPADKMNAKQKAALADYEAAWAKHGVALDAYAQECARLRLLQWPWAWADAVIAEEVTR